MRFYLLVALICAAAVQSERCGTPLPPRELVMFHQAANILGVRQAFTPFEIDIWFHYIVDRPYNFVDRIKGHGAVLDQVRVLNRYYAPAGITFNFKETTFNEKREWIFQGNLDDDDRREVAMKWSLRRGSYSALNVYIIPAFGPHSRTLGRAIYPVSNPTVEQRNFDGILIHIGSMPGGDFQNYNEGKTLVHEAGHWLSLFHLWHSDFDIPGKEGGTCIPNGGDQVDDTPQQKDATLMDGCPGDDHDTCPNLPGKDMWWNFMDYTEDRCLTSFTFGQIKKMHGSWEALRKGK